MKKTAALILLAAAALMGCLPAERTDKQPLSATEVYKGQQCGRVASGTQAAEAPQALGITDPAGLKALGENMAGGSINGGLPAPLSDFDFSAHGLLVVYMGQKPTSGYSLTIVPEKACISDQAAMVTLKWQTPAPDAITAQVVTHPCIFIKVPKGDFSKIRILDRQGRVKAVAGER